MHFQKPQAPPGHHQGTAMLSFSCLSLGISILLQRVADLLRVGYPRIELSKLAIFLVCLKGELGHALRQQLRPKRDGIIFISRKLSITVCYQINKIFLHLPLLAFETNYFTLECHKCGCLCQLSLKCLA